MSTLSNPNSSLSKEELLLRLEEAEETLRAIRSGEVDALIVSGGQGDQIFTLKDASHPYQILVEEMNEGALTLTSDGMILYSNSRFAEILSFPKETILGESFFHFVVPGDQARAKRFLEQSLQGNIRGELTLLGDQAEISVAISLKEIKLEEESRLGVVVSDLTERKRSEDEIRSLLDSLEQRVDERTQQLEFERARWQGIVEGIADEVWSSDVKGNLSLLNLGAIRAGGLDRFKDKPVEEVYRDMDFFYPSGQPRPPEQSPLLRSLRGEIVRGEEIMLHRETGQTRYRQFSSAPTRDASGAISGAVAIVRDITEQKQAEEGLRRFELLSEYSKDIVLFMRRKDGRILDANLAAQRAYGYSREELLTFSVRKLRARGTRELTGDQMIQADQEGILFETVHQRKDGSTFPVEVSSQGAVIGGVPTLINIVRDITERKQAESKLAYQAELLSRVRDAVVGMDERLQISFWNTAAEEMFGWMADEAIGRDIVELFKTQIKGYSREEVIQKLLTTDEFNGEMYYVRKDDSSFIGHAMSIALKGPRGDFKGAVTTVRDITERKKAEERHAYLASFPRRDPNPITEADFDGQVRYANPAALHAFPDLNRQGPAHAWLANWDNVISLFLEDETELKTRDVVVGERIYQQVIQYIPEEHLIRIYGTDITERKRAEAAQQESQSRLTAVFAAIPYVILEFDANLEPIMANPAAMEALGAASKDFTWNQVIEKLKFQRMDGSTGPIEDLPTSRALRGETVTQDLYKIKTFDGKEHIVSIYATPLYKDGKVNSVVALWHDLTERIRAEDALRESEERYRAVVEHAMDAIIVADPSGEGRVLAVNPAACRMFGYSMEEFVGLDRESILDTSDPNFKNYMEQRVYQGQITAELTYKRKEDVRFSGELSSANYQDKNGEQRTISIIRDITERKQADEELRASEERFRTLFETMTEGFALNEIISNEAGEPHDIRFIDANPAFERHTGLKVADVLGHTTRELFPDTEQAWFEHYAIIAVDGKSIHFQDEFKPLGRWFEVSAYQIGPNRFASVFSDITKRKQAEEQLSAALQEKVVLLKEIHHRVKNNLQVISSLLRLQSASLSDPQVRELFDDSQRRVRAMALIHEQLYQSSNLAQINFKDYIHNLVHYLRRSYTQTVPNVEIHFNVEEVNIEMDQAVPLGLIVNELVSNSLKHAFPSGHSARIGEVWITARREPSSGLVVSVGDNGVGIPENLDIENSSTMGLQLVRSFVIQLRGQLTIQRKPGTTFTVTIPEKKG